MKTRMERDLERDDADRDHQLGNGRKVTPVSNRGVADHERIEAVENGAAQQGDSAQERGALAGAAGRRQEDENRGKKQRVLDPEHRGFDITGEGEIDDAAIEEVCPADYQPNEAHPTHDPRQLGYQRVLGG